MQEYVMVFIKKFRSLKNGERVLFPKKGEICRLDNHFGGT